MKNFERRSCEKELIDEPGIPFADWEQCLRELNMVNTWLGGHRITVEGVKELLPCGISHATVAEIGCGGGDNLKAIHRWNKERIPVEYIGIDLNKACVDFAKANCAILPDSVFIHSDYKKVDFNHSLPDIIFNSLFCHHFSDEELVAMLVWMRSNSGRGFFINDLQRHPAAYYSIRWLTKLFSSSYLVKNDGPVSVARGFRRAEWESLLSQAGIKHFTISWRWAFRYLIIVKND